MATPVDRRSFMMIAAATGAASAAASAGASQRELITLVGYNDMKEMLTALNAEFIKLYPGFSVAMDLPGTHFAPAALAAGRSTLAPMGARITPDQLAKFVAINASKPVGFRIAHASLDPRALSGPNGIFVQRDNPLSAVSLDTVSKLFTAPGPHYWRDLGVAGELRNEAIVVTGMSPQSALALEFREAIFQDRDFAGDYRGFGQSRDVIALVGRERAALGFAALNRGSDLVRALAISRTARSPAVAATASTLRSGRYPLDRHLWIYARVNADGHVSAVARIYLAFVLSPRGQAIVARGSLGYLPLGDEERRLELAKLRG